MENQKSKVIGYTHSGQGEERRGSWKAEEKATHTGPCSGALVGVLIRHLGKQ